MSKAIILLSGGLDSVTTLAIASQSYKCYALSIDYGQKQISELNAAIKYAKHYHVIEHKIIKSPISQIQNSALTNNKTKIPKYIKSTDIPVTYVPARNTIFLSYALSYAETLNIYDIFVGVNAIDFSGYPDCREEYINCYEKLMNLATDSKKRLKPFKIHAPLINMAKDDIIKYGLKLGIDYKHSISCYQADDKGRACGICDACHYRRQGFLKLNIKDQTKYF